MTTHFAADTATLTGRSMRHIFRSPDTIITTVVTPVAAVAAVTTVAAVTAIASGRSW